MKALKNIIILLFINYTVLSCAQEKKNRNNNQDLINIKSENKNMKNIEKILIDQIESGAAEEYNSFEHYSERDLNVLIIFEDSILKSNGFKILETKQFNDKVKKIFNRIIDNSSQNEYLKIDTYKDNTCDKKLVYYPHSAEFQNIYISKTNRFLTYFHPLPQIIDYKKLYPQLSKYEEKPFTIETIEGKIDITRWKDIPDLDQQRKRNIETLVARNMYLFNDSKAHLRWLVLHDEYFMRSLVTTFGYYEDKELLKWAIENTESYDDDQYKKSDFKGLSEILWNKKCDNSYVINTNALQIIKEISTPKNYSRIFDVYTILQDLVHSNEEFSFDEIPFKDKAKIVAHLLEFGEQFKYDEAYGYDQMFLGKFIYYLDTEKKYFNEFELNNYYNLPNLKKWYQLAKTEKDKFANDETLMDDPNFTDYYYKRKKPKK